MVKRLSLGPRRYVTVIGMVSLVAIAGVALNFAWRSIVEPVEPGIGSGIARPATAANDLVLRPVEKGNVQLDNLLERPLFSPERRPSMPVVAKAAIMAPVTTATIEAAPIYALGGIIVSSKLSKALLRGQRREDGRWFTLGETTDEGWTVGIIDPNQVTLGRGERRMMLTLYAREPLQPTVAIASEAARSHQLQRGGLGDEPRRPRQTAISAP